MGRRAGASLGRNGIHLVLNQPFGSHQPFESGMHLRHDANLCRGRLSRKRDHQYRCNPHHFVELWNRLDRHGPEWGHRSQQVAVPDDERLLRIGDRPQQVQCLLAGAVGQTDP